MLILEALYHLIHLISDESLMSIQVARESEIVGCSERWDTGECDLACYLRESRYEEIEGIVDTIMLELTDILLLCLEKHSRHRLHQIVYEYPESSRRRKSSCAIIWLEEQSHLFERHHIISNSR